MDILPHEIFPSIGNSAVFEQIVAQLSKVTGPDNEGNIKALCPFHSEKHPSFSVHPNRGYKCFTCSAKGSINELASELGVYNERIGQGTRAFQKIHKTYTSQKFDWQQATIYKYLDEEGKLLFEVGRIGTGSTKQVRQRRPDGCGGWHYTLGNVRRVLYHLPELMNAKTVFICEGEKAADALNEALLKCELYGESVATTNPQGANSWKESFSPCLKEKLVFILPDNDQPGRDHAQAVALSVYPYAAQLKVVELPDLPAKGDVVDFLDSGATIPELIDYIGQFSVWSIEEENSPNSFNSYSERSLDLNDDSPALHGLAGEIIRTISPHSESAQIALLCTLLVMFGSAVGRSPHWKAGATRHGLNLFAVLVGKSAKARKGSSWTPIEDIFRRIDSSWSVRSGLSSGEGIIWHLRDPENESDTELTDKRCMIYEPEFAQVLQCIERKGNNLSSILRNAWDGVTLETLTKNNPCKATHTHISILAHTTQSELKSLLSRSDTMNGFANRFLWFYVERSKLLPDGGDDYESELLPLVQRLKAALDFGRSCERIDFDEAALNIWRRIYPYLSDERVGILDAVTSRAEAQVRRIACIYALLDQSASVRSEHLMAALDGGP